MSGHSKWSTIKNKKAKNDGARAKIFTKIGRELIVAIKEGGSADPNVNSKLKDCIAKAKANNVPNDNIERIIKKAASDGDQSKYEAITYEGYGPGGIAVIVEKFGGNLGTQGCVSFMFERKGVLITESEDLDEDTVMEDALENGASDFKVEDGVFEIYTEPEDFSTVNDALTAKGYTFIEAEIEMVPGNYTKLEDEEQITKMQRLLDNLEDNDDVQNVWHNWEYDAPEEED